MTERDAQRLEAAARAHLAEREAYAVLERARDAVREAEADLRYIPALRQTPRTVTADDRLVTISRDSDNRVTYLVSEPVR